LLCYILFSSDGTDFPIHRWTGGQIKNSDDADDISGVDLSQIHYLSGPVALEGAEPGDAVLVEILDISYFESMPWGYTGGSSQLFYVYSRRQRP
jgi:acetamidase/formamidase